MATQTLNGARVDFWKVDISDLSAMSVDGIGSSTNMDQNVNPVIDAGDDGRLGAFWERVTGNPVRPVDIVGQLFADDGSPVGGEVDIDDAPVANEKQPSTAVLRNGTVVVAYSSDKAELGNFDVYVRTSHAPTGLFDPEPILINVSLPGQQDRPNVVSLFDPAHPEEDARFLVAYRKQLTGDGS